ncbi:MAG: DUF6599 family protein [Acidobacteriota bacterium]
MRCIPIVLCGSALACLGASAAAQAKAPAPQKQPAVTVSVPRPLLPQVFDGWVASQKPAALSDASQADNANAAALKEYGFAGGMMADYKRDNETLTVKALRFADVSGAYGAYSFYRGNNWPKEEIGAGAASDHNRVLLWKGTTVVDATFSHVEPESASELRDLAAGLPAVQGTRALTPPLLYVLPKHALQPQTTHYAQGPASYVGSGGVLPPQLIGFDRDAETVTANYSLPSGPATLTLINYPTPQMAIAQEKVIGDYIHAGSKAQPPFPKPLQDSDQVSLEVRRSGPVVALVSGDAIPQESHDLLESVHYESDYVSIPQPGMSEISKVGRFFVGVTMLVVIGAGAALLLAFFLGGGKALYRIARGKPASSVYETEFIRLDLHE